MKYLLVAINAKYIHSNLAVYSLKAFAGKKGIPVELKEYTINQPKDYILKDIYMQKPDAVFFSCYIWNIAYVESIVKNLNQVAPKLPIFLGGPEVSFDAREVLRRMPFLAGVLCGEGEETFAGILQSDWKELIWGRVYGSVPVNMDDLPFVYENMDMNELAHRIIYYESSRGCPFSCSYCLSSVDKHLRFRSLELVKKELQFFIDHKVPQVKFVDRTFNCKKDHALAIWRYILEHDQGYTNFHFEVAADLLTDEMLEVMEQMRPGLIQLEIGVQSTNPETLKAIKRTMKFEKVAEIVNRIHSFKNIHQHLDLIAGLPYENYERFRQSFNDVYALAPNQLQLGFLKVLKGSYMHQMAEYYSCRYRYEAPYEVLSTEWITFDELIKLKSVDKMVDIYYNSGQFTTCLPYLVEAFDTPFDFFLSLGDFYEKKGYEILSHSRVRRYDILLEFAEDCNRCGSMGIKEDCSAGCNEGRNEGRSEEHNGGCGNSVKTIDTENLKTQMTIDLYLREKLKKAPVWAVDLSGEYVFDYEKRDPLTGNAIMRQV